MSDLTPFLTDRPGIFQGRIEEDIGIVPDDGEYLLVLGATQPGFVRRFKVGDRIEFAQSGASVDAGKILRFVGKVFGVSQMPSMSGTEPFSLSDGQTLNIRIDEGTVQIVTFDTADFSNIAAATALEVRDVINSVLVDGKADLTGDGQVSIFSNKQGKRSRARITGGTGAVALAFQELAWKLVAVIGVVVVRETLILPGEERSLTEFGSNLAGKGSSVDIKFRLELGVRT